MSNFVTKIYKLSPDFIQNCFVSLYDYKQYSRRHGGSYRKLKDYYKQAIYKSRSELVSLQRERLTAFLNHAVNNSPFYRQLYSGIDIGSVKTVDDLSKLPVIDKETLRQNINKISTISPRNAYIGQTGGTTGKALKVFFSMGDIQDRYAMLDAFRERYGYVFGKRMAWFSGKDILTERDIRINRFWKTDLIHNIRFYSTFHITNKTIPYYLDDLIKFNPSIFSGFPSNMYDLGLYVLNNSIDIGSGPKSIFTTAEILTDRYREVIEKAFKTRIYDQYSSSEGAPFIFECEKGKMHYHLLSGVIETVDDNLKPAESGEMLVTSFSTKGTPLIRYRIDDSMIAGSLTCDCGDNNPVIEKIIGREIDYVYSPERGKINAGNISNIVKYAAGIIKIQIVQNDLRKITIKVVKSDKFTVYDQNKLIDELKARLGNNMELIFDYVDDIPKEKSGKYSIIKNSIKHLIE